MLYTPVPGTPLFFEMQREGRMLEAVELADIHGQHKFNFRHAAISRDESKRFLDAAFQRDFERNGPSIFRICETQLAGWKRYRHHPDARVRARFTRETKQLQGAYTAALWAMEKRLRRANPTVARRITALRKEVEAEFGWKTRLLRRLAGPLLLWTAAREARRLAHGKSKEPPTIFEVRNWDGKRAAAPIAIMPLAMPPTRKTLPMCGD